MIMNAVDLIFHQKQNGRETTVVVELPQGIP